MITKEKQKAIIEALLFISTQPVTLQQMIRKIRFVIKKEAAAANPETIDEIVTQEAEIQPEFSLPEVPVEILDPSEVTLSEEQPLETSPEEASNDDDAMLQLLQKQKELDDDVNKEEIKLILQEIQEAYAADDRGIELVSVAKGYQFRTKYEISCYLKEEQPDSPTRLSPSSLETLAIIAYQQPVPRQKIEEVRGVDSGGVLKTLLEKEFIRIVGRSDEPGKPLIYGTTQRFLEVFGLVSLRDLPSLQDFKDMSFGDAESGEKSDVPDYDQGILSSMAMESDSDQEELTGIDISEAEQAILDDLDSSLKNLKDVEKRYEKSPES